MSLVKGSAYLRAELNKYDPQVKYLAKGMELGEEITSADFGLCVSVLFCSYGTENYEFRGEHDGGSTFLLVSCLRLCIIPYIFYYEKPGTVA